MGHHKQPHTHIRDLSPLLYLCPPDSSECVSYAPSCTIPELNCNLLCLLFPEFNICFTAYCLYDCLAMSLSVVAMTNDNQMHIGFKQVLRRAFLFVWRGAYPLSPIEGNYQTALKRLHKWVLALTWCDIWMRVWRVLGISRLQGTWSLLVLMTAQLSKEV